MKGVALRIAKKGMLHREAKERQEHQPEQKMDVGAERWMWN